MGSEIQIVANANRQIGRCVSVLVAQNIASQAASGASSQKPTSTFLGPIPIRANGADRSAQTMSSGSPGPAAPAPPTTQPAHASCHSFVKEVGRFAQAPPVIPFVSPLLVKKIATSNSNVPTPAATFDAILCSRSSLAATGSRTSTGLGSRSRLASVRLAFVMVRFDSSRLARAFAGTLRVRAKRRRAEIA